MFGHDENDKSQIVTNDDVPDRFLCPITLEIMEDPVITETGHIFGRKAITEWLKDHNNCPKTNLTIKDKKLTPVHKLRGEIIAWKEQQAKNKVTEKEAPETKGKEKEKEKEQSFNGEKEEKNLYAEIQKANNRLLIIQLGMIEGFLSRIELENKLDYQKQVISLLGLVTVFNKRVIGHGDFSKSDAREFSREYAELGNRALQLFGGILQLEINEISKTKKEECWLLFDSSVSLNQDVRNIQSTEELDGIFNTAKIRNKTFLDLLPPEKSTQNKLYSSTPTYSPTIYAPQKRSDGTYDHLLKMILLGYDQSGKKSLLLRFSDDSFTPHFIATIGMDFRLRTLEIKDKRIKLQVWYNSKINQRYANHSLRGTNIVAWVFDLSKLSKSNIEENFSKMKRHVEMYADRDATIMAFGAKCDLPGNDLSDNEFHLCAKKYGFLSAIVSAKTGQGVDEAFYRVAEAHLSKMGIIATDKKEEKSEISEMKNAQARCNLM